MSTGSVAASGGDPLAEAVALTRRLKLPHIRRHLVELVPTARAQRWDHAELVRVLLAEEAAGRDATNLRTRRQRAGFPAGKTLHDWDAAASCIPRPTQDALTSLEWVGRRENVCICGPSGTGKSHFCEALGQAAVEAEGDALGGILRLHVDEDRPELLPAGWGRPLPSGNNRLAVSHLLPIRPPEAQAARP